ncbi:hypothetical protein ABZW30_39760 [Kitasatospora sp. NPDC004669]|uniref:hypothetical protein n=1 Tax=Kitasatospora sp. NPDC004669 TaxID=3154555 RepID=UPI0033A5086E
MPLGAEGLVVTLGFGEGLRGRFNFADLPVAEPMQRSLARLFAARSAHWNSHDTARAYWTALSTFARFLADQPEPVEDLDCLSAATLKRWRARNVATGGGITLMRHIRPLLKLDERLASGPVAEELLRRLPTARPTRRSYSEQEHQQVVLAAQRQFRAALLRVRDNARLLEAWQGDALPDGSPQWQIGMVLDELARTGHVPMTSGRVVRHRRLLGATWENSWGRLYLDRSELTALAVLLTHRFGWNLAVYDRLPVPVTAPSAGTDTKPTYRIQVEKRRKGGGRWFSTENVTDTGPGSPGRLIAQALEATAFARRLASELAPGMDRLMVARRHFPSQGHHDPGRPAHVGPLAIGVTDGDAQNWAKAHGLAGSPFRVGRRTAVIREGRPLQHTQGTHESVYVLPDEQVRHASRDVFAAGAQEALAQARQAVFGGHLADGPDPGHTGTATADCADETSSPWPDRTGGCAADFLLCLGCPNAHVHPGHHPRLAHLHQEVRSLRSVLPEQSWRAHWGEHASRLDDLRERIGPAAWQTARARVDADDRTLVRLLLKGTLQP